MPLELSAAFLAGLVVLAIGLVSLLALRPSLVRARGGRLLAFVAYVVLPAGALAGGASLHLESSKSTEFCLSCHEMAPYGASLLYDDTDYLPAVHYQDRLIDRDRACYTCHRDYTLFGGVEAKVKGVRHVWVHYLGEPPAPGEIELYAPYENRECLHCHAGGRSFGEAHQGDLPALAAGELSCLECHAWVHDAGEADAFDRWPAAPSLAGAVATPAGGRGGAP